MKIVVFDLDETLGYFTQFGIFWDSLTKCINDNKIDYEPNFTETLDLYPEFLRPNIIPILTYLKKKKAEGSCMKVLIYTNNTGPRTWAEQIISYFEEKIHCKLFDQIIAAFKINGKRIEIGRTTYDKTHSDLIKCTKISKDTQICFIDDVFHPGMANDNIYYINIKPYFHTIPFDEMIDRFKNSPYFKETICTKTIMKNIQTYHFATFRKSDEEYEIDKILGKHIIFHLQKFFNNINHINKNKTLKHRTSKKNKTLKHYTF